jgi:uncharacterized protein YaaQ
MKLLMIIVDSECKEELEVLLARREIGYTEIPNTHGVGATGVRMGSAAFPKTSSMFVTVLPDEGVSELRDQITSYCNAGERKMKMFVWTAEEIV